MCFILGLGAAFNLSARLRSCCKLAENRLHTQGLKFCNPFGATYSSGGTEVRSPAVSGGPGAARDGSRRGSGGTPEPSAQSGGSPKFTSSNSNLQ